MNLKAKIILGVTSTMLLVSLVAIGVSYFIYVDTMNDHYAIRAQHVADTAVLGMDGDKIEEYYHEILALDKNSETYQEDIEAIKDEAYYEMLEYLLDIRQANDVLYLYVEVFDFDNMTDTYIIDADENVETAVELGHTEILPDELRIYENNLQNGIEPVFTDREEFGPIVTSGRPVYNSDGEIVALAVVDISMQKIWEQRDNYLKITSLLVVFVTIFITAVLLKLTNKKIIKPINQLALATSSYISSKETDMKGLSLISKLDIHSGDEIENLCNAVKKMECDINHYIADITSVTAEKERIDAELTIATNIQASMLPSVFPAFPNRSEFDIHATMIPAKEVGGDFYDFFLVDEDHLAMVMADVSGKGVPAALFMMIAKTLLKNSTQTGANPKDVLQLVNNQLCEGNDADLFVTVWIGVLQISTGKLIAANAGHEYPVIKRKGGSYEIYKDKHGLVLAGMENSKYSEYELQLERGDKLFVYTDGVPEATNTNDELFGIERMLKTLNKHKELNLEQTLGAVKVDVDIFVGKAPQFDDITMLGFEMF